MKLHFPHHLKTQQTKDKHYLKCYFFQRFCRPYVHLTLTIGCFCRNLCKIDNRYQPTLTIDFYKKCLCKEYILYFLFWQEKTHLHVTTQVSSIYFYTILFTEAYLCTRPEASPPASFLTSSTLTMLKSPSTECFKQLAATANSIVDCGS